MKRSAWTPQKDCLALERDPCHQRVSAEAPCCFPGGPGPLANTSKCGRHGVSAIWLGHTRLAPAVGSGTVGVAVAVPPRAAWRGRASSAPLRDDSFQARWRCSYNTKFDLCSLSAGQFLGWKYI